MNTYLNDLAIATTDGATDRDELEALCRRDATLITHVDSRAQFAERRERLQMKEEEKLARRIRQAERDICQQEQDDAVMLPLLQNYRQDMEINLHLSEFASWKRLHMGIFKSFYRRNFAVNERPHRQPS